MIRRMCLSAFLVVSLLTMVSTPKAEAGILLLIGGSVSGSTAPVIAGTVLSVVGAGVMLVSLIGGPLFYVPLAVGGGVLLLDATNHSDPRLNFIRPTEKQFIIAKFQETNSLTDSYLINLLQEADYSEEDIKTAVDLLINQP